MNFAFLKNAHSICDANIQIRREMCNDYCNNFLHSLCNTFRNTFRRNNSNVQKFADSDNLSI